MKTIEESIRHYIAHDIIFSNNGFPYRDDTPFLEEGILDSTNVLQLVNFVEEQFHVTIDDREVVPDNFDSVSKLSAFVRHKLGVAPS